MNLKSPIFIIVAFFVDKKDTISVNEWESIEKENLLLPVGAT